MSRLVLSLLIVLGVACLALGIFAVSQWIGREALDRQYVGVVDERDALAVDIEDLLGRVEAANEAEQALRAMVTEQKTELASLRFRIDELENPPFDEPTCFDSDVELGDGAVFRRGFVEVRSKGGVGRSADHCRLGKLIEFSCVENPPGSNRFIPDSRSVACPSDSRCVAGECLR